MIRLDLKREPHWLDLGHGVGVQVKPCTSAIMLAARSAASRATEPETEMPSVSITHEEAVGMRACAFLKALARLAIIGWRGVGNAGGVAADVEPDSIDALMDLWPIAEAFERQYLGPALLLADEKNA